MAHPFLNTAIEPKRTYTESWWAEPMLPRVGFTKLCRERNGDFLIADDVTDREVQMLVQRGLVLQAMAGTRAANANSAMRRAVTL